MADTVDQKLFTQEAWLRDASHVMTGAPGRQARPNWLNLFRIILPIIVTVIYSPMTFAFPTSIFLPEAKVIVSFVQCQCVPTPIYIDPNELEPARFPLSS